MKKIFLLLGVFCLIITVGFAQNGPSKPIVQKPVYFDVSPPLRDMVKYAPAKVDNSWKDGIVKNHIYPYGNENEQSKELAVDPNVQRWFGKSVTDTTIMNFDGNSNTQGYVPPDTYGEVGPNHFFQVVNCHYIIYSKTGAVLLGPSNTSSVWQGMPNNSNDGDATVSYDEVADRWIFSQFSLPGSSYFQMIAISTTPDPTGTWYRYQYQFTEMGDYPKFGVWPDGYYMTVNRFAGGSSYNGVGVMAYERAKMLIGDPSAQMIEETLPSSNEAYAWLPSDCDGAFPPMGTPNYVTYEVNQHLRIYEFHVDWTTTSNSTLTQTVTLPVNPYTPNVSGIPQLGTTKKLDPISGRIMYRLQFRKFSDHWAMAASGTVNVGNNVAGLRWYELRNTGSGWSIYQQGTYSPDNNCRWMGSIAMDSLGDMAMGFSISSASMYPSIRYTGRLASDPLGQMTIGEHGIMNGSSYESYSGSGNMRWGDYSGMTIDPSAAQVFWYTQEYFTTSGQNWKTRIASFSFANIFAVNGSATPSTICASQSSQLNAAAHGGSGTYTYSWTSIPAGFTSTIQNPVVYPTVSTQYVAAVSDGTQTKNDTILVTVNPEPTANAGSPATYPNTTPLFPASGSATSYSGVKWSTSGDGHFNMDTIPACLYYPGPVDDHNGGVDLTLKAYPIIPCVDTASSVVHITLTFPAGIGNKASSVFGITLTPNPSNGIFTLVVNGVENTEARITITDLAGKEIYSESVNSPTVLTRDINLSGFPKGIYFVKVRTDQQTSTKKLVLQ